jgi:hypothetical protein
MYYNKNVGIKSGGTPRMNFKKMVCRNTCEEIIVEDDIFEMSGTMGTSHKPEIKIIVKPIFLKFILGVPPDLIPTFLL